MNEQVPYKPGVEVKVVPEPDAPKPITSSTTVKASSGKGWSVCEECGREVWDDYSGTFYHRLSCSKSNGIGYGDERTHCFGELIKQRESRGLVPKL